jgi:hypothetical protein
MITGINKKNRNTKLKTPIIHKQVDNMSRGDYDVFVASLKDLDELPTYAIINRTTGVVEYTNENLNIVRDWLSAFAGQKDFALQAEAGQILGKAN